MKNFTLTVIDTRNLQGYIFGTNNLRQNTGASYAVSCATGKWVAQNLPKSNVHDVNVYSDEKIEDGNIDAEVVYSGGGNAVVIFKNRDSAVSFAKRYTASILKNAPGLDLTIVHKDFNWDEDVLADVLKDLQKEGAAKKLNRHFSAPLLGAPVTARCSFTGLPATHFEGRSNLLLSSEANAKFNLEEDAWANLKSSLNSGGYAFSREFNDIASGREGYSYIGVVHADGNGMSKRVDAIRGKHSSPSQNRAFISEMRKFSSSIKQSVKNSLQAVIDGLVESIEDMKIKGEIEIVNNVLPLRPIVFDGDDVTFVCHGAIALSLAHNYLLNMQTQILSDGKPFYGRAGVAIVKSHYPFARAYRLSEDLCASAKEIIKEKNSDSSVCAMDWHFAVNSPVDENIEEIRKREYKVNSGSLCMRPVLINDDDSDWRTWDVFKYLVDQFKNDDVWKNVGRNKLIALQRALRDGASSTEIFLALNRISSLPPIKGQMSMGKNGWQGGYCGYFDAIEAMDFMVDI